MPATNDWDRLHIVVVESASASAPVVEPVVEPAVEPVVEPVVEPPGSPRARFACTWLDTGPK